MADNNFNKMFGDLSQKLGMSEDNLKSAAKKGNVQDMLKNVSPEQSKQIEDILSDPEKTRQILNSPQAQALMKLFGNDGK